MATGGTGNISAKGWRWVISALTQTVASAKNKASRCRVPIVDCIFWDTQAAAAVEWIWANKHGQVVRKKTAHLNASNIVHRFAGVLEDNNVSSKVAIAFGFTGNAKVPLTFRQLQEFVTGDGDAREVLPAFDAIQLAIESKSKDCAALRNVYSVVSAGKVMTKTLAVDQKGRGEEFSSPHICHQIDLFTQRIVKHVEKTAKLMVLRIEVDYVIDASDRIWLQTFHKVLVQEDENGSSVEDNALAGEVISRGLDPASPKSSSSSPHPRQREYDVVGGGSTGSTLPPIGGGPRPQSEPHQDEQPFSNSQGRPRQLSAPTNFKSRPPTKDSQREPKSTRSGVDRPTPTPGGRVRGPLTGPVKKTGRVNSNGKDRNNDRGEGASIPTRGKANIKLRSLKSPAGPSSSPIGFAQRMQNAQARKAHRVGGAGKKKRKKKNLDPESFEAKLDSASWEQLEKFRQQREREQQQQQEDLNGRGAASPHSRSPKSRRPQAGNAGSGNNSPSDNRRAIANSNGGNGGSAPNSTGKLEEMVAQLIQQQAKQQQEQQSLEQELEQLRERLAVEVDAHHETKTESQTLKRKLAQAESKAAQRVADLENAHQQQIVEAQAMFHKELASRERLQETVTASSTAPITELIGNVKELQQRLDFKEAAWTRERTELQEKYKSELVQLRKVAQAEAAQAHARLEAKEDAIEDLQAKVTTQSRELEARTRAEMQLKGKLDNLSKQRSELEREAQSLHKQLQKAMTSSGTIASSGGTSQSAADELQSYRVATEASLRKMQHQIEFLESQLQAEGAYKEQLGAEMQQLQAKYDMAKQECANLATEFETARQAEVRKLRSDYEGIVEKERAERQRAESTAAELQIQMTSLANQIETGQKAAQKAADELAMVVDERERYSDMVVELRQRIASLEAHQTAEKQKAAAASAAAGGSTNGSTASGALEVQKLTNEITYLRRQLENESQLKADLEDAMISERMRSQAALTELTDRIGQADEAASDAIGEVDRLRSEIESLKADKENQDSTYAARIKDLRTKYDEAKVQVREKNNEVFRLSHELKEAEQSLDEMRKEHAEEAERRRKQAEAHQKSLLAVESSIGSLSAGKDQQIQELQRKHAEAFNQLGQAQQATLAVRSELSSERKTGQRSRATTTLFATVNLWLKKKLMRAFNTLKVHAREEILAQTLTQAHVEEKDRLGAEHAKMVTAQRETLEEKHAVTLKEAEEMHAAKRQELISQQDAATKSALAEQQRRLEAELGETHAAAIDQLKAEHATVKAEELQVAAHRHAEEQQAEIEILRAAAEAEASQLQEELAAKEQAHRAREQELQAAKEESLAATASHLQDKLNHEAKAHLETELAKATARHEEELRLRLAAEANIIEKKLAAEHETEVASLLAKEATALEQAETERGALVATLKEEHSRTLQSKLLEVQEELARAHAAEVAQLEKAATDKALEAERSTKEQQLELRKEATALLRETHEKELLEARRQREALEAKVSDLQTARAQLQAQLETLRGSLGVEHSKQLRELEAKNLATMQETMAESKKASDKRLGLLQQKHQAALEDLKEAHEVTLQKAAEDAEARLKKELAAARAETQKLLTLLEKDKAAALEKLAKQHEDELQGSTLDTKKTLAQEFEQQLKDVEAKHAAKIKELEEDAEVEMQDRVLEAEVAGQAKLDAFKKQAAEELAAARAEEQANRQGALQQLSESMKEQQQQVMKALKEESEALIRDFEEAIALLREEKSIAEKALADSQRSLEETEDMLYDAQQTATKMHKAGAAMRLRCTLLVVQCVGAVKRAKRQVEEKYEARIADMEEKTTENARRMQAQLEDAQERASKLDTIKLRMQDTLVNHKREVLMEHKVQSAVIHSDLAVLSKKKDELSKRYRDLKDDMGMLKGSLSTLEAEIRDVTQKSALDDGEVDVEMLRRKRRLNKEMDDLIEQIQSKQKATRAVEAELGKVEDQLEDKQDELKDLESQLVAVLMEQQKKMLSLIGSVANATTSLKAVSKFKHALDDDDDDDDSADTDDEE